MYFNMDLINPLSRQITFIGYKIPTHADKAYYNKRYNAAVQKYIRVRNFQIPN